MSPTLDRHHPPIETDPNDGLALLEGRGKPITAKYGIPLAVLLELTHKCPLQCPYCSNPVEMERARNELTTEEWKRVLDELAEIGVLQVHFSGGAGTNSNPARTSFRRRPESRALAAGPAYAGVTVNAEPHKNVFAKSTVDFWPSDFLCRLSPLAVARRGHSAARCRWCSAGIRSK